MIPVAILCGGYGTRLSAETATLPKSLVEVAGRPFLAWQIEFLARSGVTNIVLLVGHRGAQIVEWVNAANLPCQVDYLWDGPGDGAPLGQCTAIRQMAEQAFAPIAAPRFWVLYGDAYLECDLKQLYCRWRVSEAPACRTTWNGIDWGLTGLSRDALDGLTDSPLLTGWHDQLDALHQLHTMTMPHRFREMGSPFGLAALRAYLGVPTKTD